MFLKISSPSKVIYNWKVKQITLPTEKWIITVLPNHIPLVSVLKPWVVYIVPEENENKSWYVFTQNKISISVSKWIIFVDWKNIRIVTAVATTSPSSADKLNKMKEELESKIKLLKKKWNIEDIEKALINLEKINADIKLQKIKQINA